MGRENKYKAITEQLNEQKKDFERIYALVKEIRTLLQNEDQDCTHFLSQEFKYNGSEEYNRLVKNSLEAQTSNLREVKEL